MSRVTAVRSRYFTQDDPDHYRKLEDFHVQHAVHTVAVRTKSHRLYTPEQEEDGKPVARMVVYEAVTIHRDCRRSFKMGTTNFIPRVLGTLSRDGWLLFATRFARLFAYGSLSVVLVFYLVGLGLSESETGLVLTLTLVGDSSSRCI